MLKFWDKLKRILTKSKDEGDINRYYQYQYNLKLSQIDTSFDDLKKASTQLVKESEDLTKSILAKFEQFKNRFDTLFENINAQVFVLDSKKNIIEINSSACNLFGLEKNTVIGNNFDTVVEKHPILTKLFLEIKPKINMEESFRAYKNIDGIVEKDNFDGKYEFVSLPIKSELGEEREVILIMEKRCN